eukprot:gene5377-5915_t
MSDSKVQFFFDKDYKIRVFDPTKFERSEEFEKACGEFVEKISGFNEKVNALVEVLEAHASRIDQQKLRAIGLRMAVENEEEQRRRQERALQTMINEKKAELDRYNIQLQSLERIDAEQKATIEKIVNANN